MHRAKTKVIAVENGKVSFNKALFPDNNYEQHRKLIYEINDNICSQWQRK